MAKGKFPFFGKESSKEEKAEKKLGKAAYAKGEKSEGEKFACGGKTKVKKFAFGGDTSGTPQPPGGDSPQAAMAMLQNAAAQRQSAPAPAPAPDAVAAQQALAQQIAAARTLKPPMPAMQTPVKRAMKTGGSVSGFAKGGSVGGRGDGIATKGKTKGRFV